MFASVPTRRLGLAGCALLVVLTAGACGAQAASPPTPSGARPAPASASAGRSSTASADGPTQWIAQFCDKGTEDSKSYFSVFGSAVQDMGVEPLAANAQEVNQLLSTMAGATTGSAQYLTAITPASTEDAAARTFLLGVYQQLGQALTDAVNQFAGVSTTSDSQFLATFDQVYTNVETAIGNSATAIKSNSTLGPIYTANPNCR